MKSIDKKKRIWLLLIIPALLISFGLSMFVFNNEDLNLEEQHATAPLYTRSDLEWESVITSRTVDDATTNCYDHKIEGLHHVMYCDKIAGSDTELSFKTFFKSRVENYKIVEIKTIIQEKIIKKMVGIPYDCEENENGTCFQHKLQDVIQTSQSQIELPLTASAIYNDWELSAKRLYLKDEKRTYKIEWDDLAPTKKSPQITERGNGIQRITFPIIEEFYNELSINPNKTWNYTLNNWGGVASNTIIDDDGYMVADNESVTESYPDYLQDLSAGIIQSYFNDTNDQGQINNIGSANNGVKLNNAEPDSTTGVTSINGRGASSFDGIDDRVTFDNVVSATVATGFLQFWIYPEAGLELGGANDNRIIDLGGRAYIMGNCTDCGDVSKAGFRMYNAGDGGAFNGFDLIYNEWQLLTMKWNSSGHYFYQNTTLIFEDALPNGVDFSGSARMVGDGKDNDGASTFKMKMQELYYSHAEVSMQEIEDSYYTAGSLVYDSSGNRTLDGFAPNYPDIYEVVGAGFSQEDNDASNYGGLTIKTSNDNSTWTNELSYLDIIGTQASSFQLIPNITTDTTTTPKLSSAWLDYKSTKPPEVYINYPVDGATYYGIENIDLNFTLIDPDGIDSAWYSTDYGTNTSIATPTNNVSVAITSGAHTFILSANDTDGQENQTFVNFSVNLAPSIPLLNLPANESIFCGCNIPNLNWSNSTDSEGDVIIYYLEVDDTPTFDSVNYANGNIPETSNPTGDTPTGLGDGNWYWRVLASDISGNSSWSEVRQFRLELTQPQIFIDSPINSTYYNTSSVDLNTTATDPDGIDSMWWSTNLTDNSTADYLANTTISGLSEGSWIVYVYYNDSAGVENSTDLSFFVNDPPTPPILESPQNDTTFSSIPTLTINNSVDAYDTLFYYFEIANLSDFLVVDRSSGNVAEGVITTSWTPTYLADGNYSWRALATDTYGNSSWSAEVRSIVLDTTAPVVNDLGNASNLLTTVLPVKSAINITATDSNLRDCWYYTSDDLTNTTLTCNSATYTDISWATEGSKIIYGCANDSSGISACISKGVFIDYYGVSQSATASTISEGGQVIFNLTINKVDLEADYDLTSAVLLLNNTSYTSSKTSFSNGAQFIVDLFVQDGWGNTTGITHNWNWSYAIYNATSTLVNLTSPPQTLVVYDAGIDDCSSYNNMILNFSLFDEEDKTYADSNITIETSTVLMNPYNSNYLFNYSTTTNESSLEICASDNFLNYTDFNLSTITRYEFQDHVIEYHYIDNYNQSGSTLQQVSLYDLKTEDSTSFLITYKDEYYLPVESAVVDVWRYYVSEGIYRSVEHGKTNDQGETRAHLVTEDVKYIFKIRSDGSIIYTSPEYLAICQATPCQINLGATTGIIDYEDFGETDNLQYTLTTDTDNRQVVLTFATLDGSPAVMKMNVTKSDAFYNETACEDSLTSSGGTITCDVAVNRGNTTFDIWVWKDEEFVTFDSFSLVPNADDTFGQTGMILAVIIIITLPLMAITSGIAMVVFIIVGVIMAGLLTLLTGGSILGAGSSIIWLICAGVILIVKMSKRRYA